MSKSFKSRSYITPEDHYFSSKGRFGRVSYLAWMLMLSTLGFLTGLLISITGFHIHPMSQKFIMPFWTFIIIVIYLDFLFKIRRLHDLNRTGWWSLLPIITTALLLILIITFHDPHLELTFWIIVFVTNTAFSLYLMIAKGTNGANTYGRQKTTSKWEKAFGISYVIFISISFILGHNFVVEILPYQSCLELSHLLTDAIPTTSTY